MPTYLQKEYIKRKLRLLNVTLNRLNAEINQERKQLRRQRDGSESYISTVSLPKLMLEKEKLMKSIATYSKTLEQRSNPLHVILLKRNKVPPRVNNATKKLALKQCINILNALRLESMPKVAARYELCQSQCQRILARRIALINSYADQQRMQLKDFLTAKSQNELGAILKTALLEYTKRIIEEHNKVPSQHTLANAARLFGTLFAVKSENIYDLMLGFKRSQSPLMNQLPLIELEVASLDVYQVVELCLARDKSLAEEKQQKEATLAAEQAQQQIKTEPKTEDSARGDQVWYTVKFLDEDKDIPPQPTATVKMEPDELAIENTGET